MLLFEKSPKLKIVPLSDMTLLNPNAVNVDGHRHDTLFQGTLYLTLEKARKVSDLKIEFIGRQNIYVKSQYHTYETLRQTLKLDTGGHTLCPGQHTYAFSFVIPADTATYERAPRGRTYHVLRATASGLGKFGGDLVEERPVSTVSNHSETGGLPPGYSLTSQNHNEQLGYVGINMSSTYLVVSGYLRLSLVIPAIEQHVRLESIAVQIAQSCTLQHMHKPEIVEEVPPTHIPVWSLPSTSPLLGDKKPGDEITVLEQFRLQDDNILRPTTPANAKTGINFSHTLAVVIRYTPLLNNPKKEMKQIRIQNDAVFSSCCCILELLQLPAYSTEPGVDENADVRQFAFCSECLCKLASQRDVSIYGICQDEVDQAFKTERERRRSFKTDEEYQAEIQRAMQADSLPVAFPTGSTMPDSHLSAPSLT